MAAFPFISTFGIPNERGEGRPRRALSTFSIIYSKPVGGSLHVVRHFLYLFPYHIHAPTGCTHATLLGRAVRREAAHDDYSLVSTRTQTGDGTILATYMHRVSSIGYVNVINALPPPIGRYWLLLLCFLLSP